MYRAPRHGAWGWTPTVEKDMGTAKKKARKKEIKGLRLDTTAALPA